VATQADGEVARGVLESAGDDQVVLSVPGTDYRLHLVPDGTVEAAVGKRVRGTIHARALRMHRSDGGGRFIEPIYGAPRIVSGTVTAVDEDANRLLVDVSVPMWVEMHELQRADEFAVGELVNFYVESGTRFTLSDP
jgi:hypothetical protein